MTNTPGWSFTTSFEEGAPGTGYPSQSGLWPDELSIYGNAEYGPVGRTGGSCLSGPATEFGGAEYFNVLPNGSSYVRVNDVNLWARLDETPSPTGSAYWTSIPYGLVTLPGINVLIRHANKTIPLALEVVLDTPGGRVFTGQFYPLGSWFPISYTWHFNDTVTASINGTSYGPYPFVLNPSVNNSYVVLAGREPLNTKNYHGIRIDDFGMVWGQEQISDTYGRGRVLVNPDAPTLNERWRFADGRD